MSSADFEQIEKLLNHDGCRKVRDIMFSQLRPAHFKSERKKTWKKPKTLVKNIIFMLDQTAYCNMLISNFHYFICLFQML